MYASLAISSNCIVHVHDFYSLYLYFPGIKTYVKPEKGCGHVNPLYICHHPVRLSFLDKNRYAPEQVACGYGFTLIAARKSNRELIVLGTGINTESQIGYHESPPRSGVYYLEGYIRPMKIN